MAFSMNMKIIDKDGEGCDDDDVDSDNTLIVWSGWFKAFSSSFRSESGAYRTWHTQNSPDINSKRFQPNYRSLERSISRGQSRIWRGIPQRVYVSISYYHPPSRSPHQQKSLHFK